MTTPPIEDQARALMSAWAEQRAPSDAVRERTWSAVLARAHAGELGPELGAEPGSAPIPAASPAAGISASARVRLALLGLGVTATVAAILVGMSGRGTEPSPLPAPAITEARAIEDTAPRVPVRAPAPANITEAGPAFSSASTEPAPASAAARQRRPKPSSPTTPAPVASDDPEDLAVELALLGRARTSLKAGDPEAARAALDEHARRFPRGALRAERELTRITAACAAGDLDGAEQVARRFIRAHPSSTEAKRLADTCIGDRL